MNRIHKAKQRNIGSRRAAKAVLALFLLLACVIFPDVEARADSLSVRASASSVKIGDTVTVSITVPAGVSATVNLTYPGSLVEFQSASETANANGGTVSMTLGGYGGTDTATTGTVTFKAKAAGSVTFSASAPVAGNQEGDQVSIGGGSASVTVQNEASSEGGKDKDKEDKDKDKDKEDGDKDKDKDKDDSSTGDGGDDNRNKSADNSLSSLKLSAGTLSPSFRYNVTNYTATVDYSVTSVAVSAKASNANAKIESVKGGEELAVGDNRIQIVVRAENGVTATYTVTVTRKEQGEPEADEPEEKPEEPEEPKEPEDEPDSPEDEPSEGDGQGISVNGRTLFPSSAVPAGLKADGFELGEISLLGKTVPAYVDTFAGGSLLLAYLADENGENGKLYLMLADQQDEAYDYVCLHSEKGFIVILPEGDGSAPEGAVQETYDLDGYGTVDAWFSDSGRELAAVYAVNQSGARGWYTLDTESYSYVRYQEPSVPVTADDPEPEPVPDTQVKPPAKDDAEPDKSGMNRNLLIGAAVIAVLVVLTILILVMVLRRNGEDEDEDDDDLYDDDELWSDDGPDWKSSVKSAAGRGPEEAVPEERGRRRTASKQSGRTWEQPEQAAVPHDEPEKPSRTWEKPERASVLREESTRSWESPEKAGVLNEEPEKKVWPWEKPLKASGSDVEPEKPSRSWESPKKAAGSWEEPAQAAPSRMEPEEPAGGRIRKQYDKSVFGPSRPLSRREEIFAVDAGLAREPELQSAADISRIADPAPMQTVTTHKDKDDEDLEFIDL